MQVLIRFATFEEIMRMSGIKSWPAVLLSAGLVGCASAPADWGRGEIEQMTSDHGRALPQFANARSFTAETLQAPLTVDRAIQLALINNPDMRRETTRLGFAAADIHEAGRLSNPTFSLSRLSPGDPAALHTQLTLGIAFNFVNLLFLPANTRFAQAQFEAAKLSVAASALDLAADVETAWYEAVGAEQLAQMREAVLKAANASAELARRYAAAGNFSPRELAMEQAAASTAMLTALSARAGAFEKRSRLNRLMGLNAEQNRWAFDAMLAEPLPEEDALSELQRLSVESRLDVASLRRKAAAIADRYGYTRSTRLIGGIEIGAERERDFDGSINAGPTLSLELPLFNWGGGRVALVRAALDQAEAELDALVLDVSNNLQLGAAKVAASKALAQEFHHVLIPQREAIVARAQEEQNYMLIGIFEVLLAKQNEYEAYAGYIEAVRDYWVARAELTRTVGRRLPSSSQALKPMIAPTDVLKSKDALIDHSHHHGHGGQQSQPDTPISDESNAHGGHE